MSQDDETLLWRQSFDKRLDRLEQRLDDLSHKIDHGMKSIVEVTVKGFPQDDPHGHRSYHESEMEKAARFKKRQEEVITHMIKTGTWVLAAFIGLAVWTYIKTAVHL